MLTILRPPVTADTGGLTDPRVPDGCHCVVCSPRDLAYAIAVDDDRVDFVQSCGLDDDILAAINFLQEVVHEHGTFAHKRDAGYPSAHYAYHRRPRVR